MYGKYVIIDAETIISDGALVFEDHKVTDWGSYSAMRARYTQAQVIGSDNTLVCPGFINAHGHGRGLTDFQLGSTDDVLETWKLRHYPGVPLAEDTVWRSIQLLQSGVTTTMHYHNLSDSMHALDEFNTVLHAYQTTGIRVAFAPSLINRNPLIYGDNDDFIQNLPLHVSQFSRTLKEKIMAFTADMYFEAINILLQQYQNDMVRIMHGPVAPQWCTDDVFQQISTHAKYNNMKIHTHLMQTRLQDLYGRHTYGHSLVRHLDDLNVLNRHLTCGHAIWLTEDDIELLASTGAMVTHHPSCNLRIQSGISPVAAMLKKNIRIGLGMDDKTFADKKNFLDEMRLAARLHRLGSYDMMSPSITSKDVFSMATEWAAIALGFHNLGCLRKGYLADILCFDLGKMTAPFTYEGHSPIDLLIYRGQPEYIDTIILNGDIIMQNGCFLYLNPSEIANQLRALIPSNYNQAFSQVKTQMDELKRHIKQYYSMQIWNSKDTPSLPHYTINRKL